MSTPEYPSYDLEAIVFAKIEDYINIYLSNRGLTIHGFSHFIAPDRSFHDYIKNLFLFDNSTIESVWKNFLTFLPQDSSTHIIPACPINALEEKEERLDTLAAMFENHNEDDYDEDNGDDLDEDDKYQGYSYAEIINTVLKNNPHANIQIGYETGEIVDISCDQLPSILKKRMQEVKPIAINRDGTNEWVCIIELDATYSIYFQNEQAFDLTTSLLTNEELLKNDVLTKLGDYLVEEVFTRTKILNSHILSYIESLDEQFAKERREGRIYAFNSLIHHAYRENTLLYDNSIDDHSFTPELVPGTNSIELSIDLGDNSEEAPSLFLNLDADGNDITFSTDLDTPDQQPFYKLDHEKYQQIIEYIEIQYRIYMTSVLKKKPHEMPFVDYLTHSPSFAERHLLENNFIAITDSERISCISEQSFVNIKPVPLHPEWN